MVLNLWKSTSRPRAKLLWVSLEIRVGMLFLECWSGVLGPWNIEKWKTCGSGASKTNYLTSAEGSLDEREGCGSRKYGLHFTNPEHYTNRAYVQPTSGIKNYDFRTCNNLSAKESMWFLNPSLHQWKTFACLAQPFQFAATSKCARDPIKPQTKWVKWPPPTKKNLLTPDPHFSGFSGFSIGSHQALCRICKWF